MTELRELPKVLVLVYTHIAMDSRVLRQVQWLSEKYDVTSASFGLSPVEGVDHIELTDTPPYSNKWIGRWIYVALFVLRLFPILVRFNPRDREARAKLQGQTWDVIVANDVDTMPLAASLEQRHGILVDLHEYATRQDEHSTIWRLLMAPYARWLVKRVAATASAVTTVSQGLADEYRREFGITAEVVTNASHYHALSPTRVTSPLRLVHSGVPAVQRRLELMIDAMRMTQADVTLDFYLVEDGSRYLAHLKERASDIDAVRFNPPVAPSELIDILNQYDVGLSIFAPTTFNLAWCLPNKFFDYVQARLGLIIGSSPEMQHIVENLELGAVTKDFTAEALAELLDNVSADDVRSWKHASDRNARSLSSAPQGTVFLAGIDRLLDARISTDI